jgi:hypothetical protein
MTMSACTWLHDVCASLLSFLLGACVRDGLCVCVCMCVMLRMCEAYRARAAAQYPLGYTARLWPATTPSCVPVTQSNVKRRMLHSRAASTHICECICVGLCFRLCVLCVRTRRPSVPVSSCLSLGDVRPTSMSLNVNKWRESGAQHALTILPSPRPPRSVASPVSVCVSFSSMCIPVALDADDRFHPSPRSCSATLSRGPRSSQAHPCRRWRTGPSRRCSCSAHTAAAVRPATTPHATKGRHTVNGQPPTPCI